MTALLVDVKQGRVGDGIVAAIEQRRRGACRAFPALGDDTNEIPDKLIEL